MRLVALMMIAGCGGPPRPEWYSKTVGTVSYEVPEQGADGEGTVENFVLRYAGNSTRRYNIMIQEGPLFTLDWWRAQLGPDPAVTVTARPLCGGTAQMAEYTEHAAVSDAPGSLGRPLTTVVMFGEVGGKRFAAQWLVSAANRERFRADEQRFFASFRCR